MAAVIAAGVVVSRRMSQAPRRRATVARGRNERGVSVSKTFTVNCEPDEVYAFWRQLDNLPRFMKHLESVEVDGTRSHWTALGPAGIRVRWDAEMTEDSPRRIAWRSLPGAAVPNSGVVRFDLAPGGRGTELRVELRYEPPGGRAAALLAKLFGREPAQEIDDDLRRVKQLLEAGEIAQSGGSSSAFKAAQPQTDAGRAQFLRA
jgi:uncharacterized membrane protein